MKKRLIFIITTLICISILFVTYKLFLFSYLDLFLYKKNANLVIENVKSGKVELIDNVHVWNETGCDPFGSNCIKLIFSDVDEEYKLYVHQFECKRKIDEIKWECINHL